MTSPWCASFLLHDVLVLRDGQTVELSVAEDFFLVPAAEYSRGLLEANRQQSLRASARDTRPALGGAVAWALIDGGQGVSPHRRR